MNKWKKFSNKVVDYVLKSNLPTSKVAKHAQGMYQDTRFASIVMGVNIEKAILDRANLIYRSLSDSDLEGFRNICNETGIVVTI